MNPQELQIAVLDVISEIIEEPVANPEQVRETIVKLFEEADGQEATN